jgi:Amt family ammonium transporter
VHGACGIWGTLSLGLLACGKYGAPSPTGADTSTLVTGLFYGGGASQLVAQVIGSACVTVATFGAAMALMAAVKLTGTLRVSKAGEEEGLDLHEHGGGAYPEMLGGGSAVPVESSPAPVVAQPRTAET